jgi:DNA polymerase-1
MRHHIFEDSPSNQYPVGLLLKNTSFNKAVIEQTYLDPLTSMGIARNDVIAFTLNYNESGKAPNGYIKDYLSKLLPALDRLGVLVLYVADSAYFKVLTSKPKADPHHGYVLPCSIKGFNHMNVVLGLNYQALIYNPELGAKLNLSLKTLADHKSGVYTALGTGIIHSAQYPAGVQAIAAALKSLHSYPSLTCDIEAFSLRFNECGIGTIAFAWDQHNGLAFACDYHPEEDPACGGERVINHAVRALLLEFFTAYKGELTFHYAPYDVKAIIYALWMNSLLDTQGMLTGLDTMTARLHDTKIIAYLATNSTAGNVLGLKSLAHEFAGNWAIEEIKDIRRIPLDTLLQYNLVDALSTHYVRNKYQPIMENDQQGELYRGLMLSSLKLIIQLELTGMPMSRSKIAEVKTKLEGIQTKQLDIIHNSDVIKMMNLIVQTKAMVDANAKLKLKQHPLDKFAELAFNPNSGPQLQVLLYEQMGLPVLDKTDTGQPATGADTIEKLINHTQSVPYKELLQALISNGQVTKILSTFIPAFEGAISKDGSDTVWLHGCFNLGGTVSGRLSSSDP